MSDPRPKFLRRISIQDSAPEDGGGVPVHVSSVVLLDGEPHPGLVLLREGWSADGGQYDGTVVSFTVDATRAVIGKVVDGKVEQWQLDGIPVLTPTDHDWELIPAEQEGDPSKILAHVFVREFEFIPARPKAGDHVVDGGIAGTLVKCEQCSGDGLLLKPDSDAMPQSPEPTSDVTP